MEYELVEDVAYSDKEIANSIETEAISIEAFTDFLRNQGDTEVMYDAILQSVHRLEDIADYMRKKDGR